jgi:TatD DNase family protein
MLIDTHCHLDFPDFAQDTEEVVKRAKEAGVEYIINIGSSLKNSYAAVNLAKKYPTVFATVGIHPHEAEQAKTETFYEIKELSKEKKVVAIGEVGLDFYRRLSDKAIQEEVFVKFISLARERNLPLVIHCRDAQEDVLRILSREEYSGIEGVIHCFSGDESFLSKCLDLGFYISFTCNITYKKADNLRRLVQLVPLDRLMLETDAPFLSPEGFRGRRNEPRHIKLLAQEISRIKQKSLEDIAQVTTQNAKKLFGLQV